MKGYKVMLVLLVLIVYYDFRVLGNSTYLLLMYDLKNTQEIYFKS